MKKIIRFNKNGVNANMYNLEEVYNSIKNNNIIEISSILLLDRFKQAAKDKEIDGFILVVTDLDDTKITCNVNSDGGLEEEVSGTLFNSKLFKVNTDLQLARYRKKYGIVEN